MEIEYERLKESRLVKRRFQSVGIIFQGCYFSSLFLSHPSLPIYRILASSYFDQSSLWPQRSQNFWYSLSSVILHLGQSAYEHKVGKTWISVTFLGSRYVGADNKLKMIQINLEKSWGVSKSFSDSVYAFMPSSSRLSQLFTSPLTQASFEREVWSNGLSQNPQYLIKTMGFLNRIFTFSVIVSPCWARWQRVMEPSCSTTLILWKYICHLAVVKRKIWEGHDGLTHIFGNDMKGNIIRYYPRGTEQRFWKFLQYFNRVTCDNIAFTII